MENRDYIVHAIVEIKVPLQPDGAHARKRAREVLNAALPASARFLEVDHCYLEPVPE